MIVLGISLIYFGSALTRADLLCGYYITLFGMFMHIVQVPRLYLGIGYLGSYSVGTSYAI
jgi:hypothetical protein